jgi:hypothetical protein
MTTRCPASAYSKSISVPTWGSGGGHTYLTISFFHSTSIWILFIHLMWYIYIYIYIVLPSVFNHLIRQCIAILIMLSQLPRKVWSTLYNGILQTSCAPFFIIILHAFKFYYFLGKCSRSHLFTCALSKKAALKHRLPWDAQGPKRDLTKINNKPLNYGILLQLQILGILIHPRGLNWPANFVGSSSSHSTGPENVAQNKPTLHPCYIYPSKFPSGHYQTNSSL